MQRHQDFQNKKLQDQKKKQEQLKKALEDKKKKQEQTKKAQEDKKKKQEQAKKAQEDKKKKQEQAKKAQEDKKKKQEQAKKALEDKKQKQEQAKKTLELQEEEQKQQRGNVFILLQQQALKYHIHSQTWSLIELKFDTSCFQSNKLNDEQICQFNLASSSSGCAQLYGLQKRDFIITGGVFYSELSFYASTNPTADAITISSGPNLNLDRHSHAVAVSGGESRSEEAYLVGGLQLFKQDTKEEDIGINLTQWIEVLNLNQNKEWKILQNLKLKYGRISPSAIVIGNYLYVIGGFSQKHINSQKLPEYTDQHSLQQFVERFDISNKSDHTLLNIQFSKPQKFPAASFNVIPIYSKNQIYIAGGTTGKKVLNSIFRLTVEQNKITAHDEEIKMEYCHADSMVSRLGDIGMYIFGGAESYGICEFVNFEQKQVKRIFSYQSCLKKASTTRGIVYGDLRWSCCFYK